MSLYFFTLDSLRELSHLNKEAHAALNKSWPNPSIAELADALSGLCGRTWQGDLQEIAETAHEYTRPAVLPHRCLEAVYMVTLLRDGFGFADDSRDITFTFLVQGSEVEWSLGMALALKAQEDDETEASIATTPSANRSDGEDRMESSQSNNTYDEDRVCLEEERRDSSLLKAKDELVPPSQQQLFNSAATTLG